MSTLDQKINEHFAGKVVRKDLIKAVRGNAVVPSYVLEYLLGQYAASDDPDTIDAGITKVRDILATHYVNRNEAGLIRSRIREKGRFRVIDRISVSLNDKADVYEAEFANLGIKEVLVPAETVTKHQKLLVGGVWCICDVEYFHSEDQRVSPWILESLKPIQLSHFDFDEFLEARKAFTTEEWIDLLMQSIGFNPEMFGHRGKLLQLMRLIPFVERNYNLVELGPKGTGKSHVFSEFSPHGMLISGGEVTVPKLFVNNGNGKIGLVGYWDVVAFDEFAGRDKRTDKALVDIMKNYMANKTFSRGIETLGAEASMVFVGNTSHTVPYMLKHSDLFDELPKSYHDPAFLDRLHNYIPGWEVDIIRGEMFSNGYGFVVDYIAEILKSMRIQDRSNDFAGRFTLSRDISTRDRDGILKTFSGLMKILFPHGEASDAEIEEILRLAIEGRKRVKDQILRIDGTMPDVKFGYTHVDGAWSEVATLEEMEYPSSYRRSVKTPQEMSSDDHAAPVMGQGKLVPSPPTEVPQETQLKPGYVEFLEGQKGASYRNLLMPYLRGAKFLKLSDPYIRKPHQIRNLEDFVALLAVEKAPEDEVSLHVRTMARDDIPGGAEQQGDQLKKLMEAAATIGVVMSFDIAAHGDFHDRVIVSDNGWRVTLGKGLDIFQATGPGALFSARMQEFRTTSHFTVTYLKEEQQ
ncbi:BREX system Lon protease-like protein BrxL (plasmid) [Coraliomargarita sp. W4R53]